MKKVGGAMKKVGGAMKKVDEIFGFHRKMLYLCTCVL